MNWMDAWLFPLGSVLLGGVGLLVLVRGLFGKRFAVRKTRACRKCRYDMTSTEGHRCPECGYVAKHEGEHYAGRRRWVLAGLGVVLLVGAVGVGMTPGVRRDGWLRLLPLELQVRVFHLETNEDAYGALIEQIHVSQGFTGGGAAPGFGPGSMLPVIRPGRMDRLELVLHRVSIQTLARSKASERAVNRSFTIIGRYTRDQLTDAERLSLVDTYGVQHLAVQQLLARCDVSDSPELARARRNAFVVADSNRRKALGRGMVRYSGGAQDAPLIGEWLAIPEYNGDPGYEHARNRIGDFAKGSIPNAAWEVYAGLIRAEGACGNFHTLRDAASRSPAVCAAAVNWSLSLEEGSERDRWIHWLTQVYPIYDAALIDADWSLARAEAESERKLYSARGAMRLMRGLDAGFSAWLIGLARDSESSHRETAMYELRGMRFGSQEAIEYAFGEGWRDETLSLNARMWPLVQMESWYGDAIPIEMDLAVYWGEVLERAAAGQQDAFEQGFGRFRKLSHGQSRFAMIAIGRRLLEMGDLEPWLPRLAVEVAESNKAEPSLQGYVKVLRDQSARFMNHRDGGRVIQEQMVSLADRLEAKFGPWAGDPEAARP